MAKWQVTLTVEADSIFEVPGILNRETDFLPKLSQDGLILPLDDAALEAERRALQLLS